jgi:hypothetical protein
MPAPIIAPIHGQGGGLTARSATRTATTVSTPAGVALTRGSPSAAAERSASADPITSAPPSSVRESPRGPAWASWPSACPRGRRRRNGRNASTESWPSCRPARSIRPRRPAASQSVRSTRVWRTGWAAADRPRLRVAGHCNSLHRQTRWGASGPVGESCHRGCQIEQSLTVVQTACRGSVPPRHRPIDSQSSEARCSRSSWAASS